MSVGRRNISLGKRASEEQKDTLVEYLEERAQRFEQNRDQRFTINWNAISATLNSMDGANKNGSCWKKYWDDLRNRTKEKHEDVEKQLKTQTDLQQLNRIKRLTPIEERIVTLVEYFEPNLNSNRTIVNVMSTSTTAEFQPRANGKPKFENISNATVDSFENCGDAESTTDDDQSITDMVEIFALKNKSGDEPASKRRRRRLSTDQQHTNVEHNQLMTKSIEQKDKMIEIMEKLVSLKEKEMEMREEDLQLKRKLVDILDQRQQLKSALPAVEHLVNLISKS